MDDRMFFRKVGPNAGLTAYRSLDGERIGYVTRSECIELRDLLLREFPVESAPPVPADKERYGTLPTTDWPDPDEVRRALEQWNHNTADGDEEAVWGLGWDDACVFIAVCRAYLRMREEQRLLTCAECGGPVTTINGVLGTLYQHDCPLAPQQPAEPALSIEQVIAACGDGCCGISMWRLEDGRWGIISGSEPSGTPTPEVIADTPEAAIQQLGRDAIAKLRERHAADAQKLKELGVEP